MLDSPSAAARLRIQSRIVASLPLALPSSTSLIALARAGALSMIHSCPNGDVGPPSLRSRALARLALAIGR